MDSLKGTLTPMKVLNGTLNGGIAYGTFNYNELENKPSINGILLQGNVVIFIPVKTSDLANDSGFITSADIPTKLSELINDAGFITITDVPTKLSELLNDAGFITLNDIPAIPTKTSELNNDSGFLTMLTTPVKSVNSQTGDVNLFIPNATSQLNNDAGFITDSNIPVQSVNGKTGEVELTAEDLSYNGGTKTTKEAIDEKSNAIIKQEFTTSYTIAANGYVNVDTSFISVPSGYSFFGVVGWTTNDINVVVPSMRPFRAGIYSIQLRNISSSSQTHNLVIDCLFIKNS